MEEMSVFTPGCQNWGCSSVPGFAMKPRLLSLGLFPLVVLFPSAVLALAAGIILGSLSFSSACQGLCSCPFRTSSVQISWVTEGNLGGIPPFCGLASPVLFLEGKLSFSRTPEQRNVRAWAGAGAGAGAGLGDTISQEQFYLLRATLPLQSRMFSCSIIGPSSHLRKL